MSIKLFVLFIFVWHDVAAQEFFTKDKIAEYMTKENPYMYTAIAEEYIYKEKEKYALGSFDTKLSAQYDKKEYPISTGEYVGISVDKPIENGMEFSLGYRKAVGTQEYNNIKTSEQGEAKIGVKIPVVSVIHNMSKRKLDLHNAALETRKYKFKSKDNLRLLYFEITSAYNQLLYRNSVVNLEKQLYERVSTREKIITKKVSVGELADIVLIEASQQVLNRKQRLLHAQNEYENRLKNFLRYLNLSKERFFRLYKLPTMPKNNYHKSLAYSAQSIIENRADLKVYDYEIKQIDLDNKQTGLLKYPKFNVALYGVHDFKYENGFKVSLDMDFPIERRKYEAKSAQNRMSITNIQKTKEKQILNIKTKLHNINNSLAMLANNIESSLQELALVTKLEQAENKKYKLGMSNLFMVNQREVSTLNIRMKLLKYKLDYLVLEQAFEKEVGTSFDTVSLSKI